MAAAVGRQPGLSWLDEVAMCGAKQRELGRWRRSDGGGGRTAAGPVMDGRALCQAMDLLLPTLTGLLPPLSAPS
jgi:hypothetical protein